MSLREALALRKDYIDTEHILLGLIREGHAVGAQVLDAAAPLAAVRERALLLAASEPSEPGPDEQLAVEWLASGSQPAAAACGVRPAPPPSSGPGVVSEFRETLASIGGTLAALERRLTGIERQLGITAEAAQGRDEPTGQRRTPLRPGRRPVRRRIEPVRRRRTRHPRNLRSRGPRRKRNCWFRARPRNVDLPS